MLTYLLVRLADAYSMIIFIYVMMSWLPNTQSGIIGDIVSIKDDSIVIETTTDRVRVEFAKFAVSTNNTAEKEAAKQKAAALAARKEQKEKEKKTKKEK